MVTYKKPNYCIHLAHAGDSRVVVSVGGVDGELIASEDHKPSRDDEMARIRNAGGFVDQGALGGPLRVDGTLAVSRAFADFHFKPVGMAPELCKVTAYPEVRTVSAGPGDWILIACDGIFDVFSNAEVRDFINARVSPGEIANGATVLEELLKSCLEKGSKDNCTAMLVQLSPDCEPKAYERSLNPGDYHTTQDGEVLKRYREFFEAEGFSGEAALRAKQSPAG
jgi:serine/threonine protein phosphatase PrpC